MSTQKKSPVVAFWDLEDHPTWTVDEGKQLLLEKILGFLGDERGRLRAFDCVQYFPRSVNEAMAAARAADGYSGPMVQVVGMLTYAGNEDSGRVFRFNVPHLLRWKELGAWADTNLAPVFRNAKARMRRTEIRSRTAAIEVGGGSRAPLSAEPSRIILPS